MTSAAFFAPSFPSSLLSFAGWWRESPLNLIHGRLRHVRGIVKSVIPSLSRSHPLVPLGHHLCLLLLNRFSPPTHPSPQPFLSRLLYATESISRVFSRASPPPPHLSPSPPEDSFRELCGKFPLLPLPNLSTSTLFQLRQLIISFSMNPAISISVS